MRPPTLLRAPSMETRSSALLCSTLWDAVHVDNPSGILHSHGSQREEESRVKRHACWAQAKVSNAPNQKEPRCMQPEVSLIVIVVSAPRDILKHALRLESPHRAPNARQPRNRTTNPTLGRGYGGTAGE